MRPLSTNRLALHLFQIEAGLTQLFTKLLVCHHKLVVSVRSGRNIFRYGNGFSGRLTTRPMCRLPLRIRHRSAFLARATATTLFRYGRKR
ncbi:hypothetical protein WS62_02555 [Burkholderia sp. ABCPW 14]|nr:hypothetical protein WS62_02555 [Burkholderia sp. ABCPW 14]